MGSCLRDRKATTLVIACGRRGVGLAAADCPLELGRGLARANGWTSSTDRSLSAGYRQSASSRELSTMWASSACSACGRPVRGALCSSTALPECSRGVKMSSALLGTVLLTIAAKTPAFLLLAVQVQQQTSTQQWGPHYAWMCSQSSHRRARAPLPSIFDSRKVGTGRTGRSTRTDSPHS